MSPAAALALIAVVGGWVVLFALGRRRDRRRDPLALTDDELAALVDRHGDREVGR